MPRILMNPPLLEPLTLAEAKLWLRIDHAEEDTLIQAFVAGCRQRIEGRIGRALVSQGWRMLLDAWPAASSGLEVPLAPPPVLSVTAVKVIDAQGIVQTVPPASYRLEWRREPPLLIFTGPVPQPGRSRAGIEIDLVCGSGPAPADVPEPIRQALRLLLSHAYEHRSLTEPVRKEPPEINALLAPYRTPRLGGR
jgi:uncharacterized phiE125 gp8 family phage protein